MAAHLFISFSLHYLSGEISRVEKFKIQFFFPVEKLERCRCTLYRNRWVSWQNNLKNGLKIFKDCCVRFFRTSLACVALCWELLLHLHVHHTSSFQTRIRCFYLSTLGRHDWCLDGKLQKKPIEKWKMLMQWHDQHQPTTSPIQSSYNMGFHPKFSTSYMIKCLWLNFKAILIVRY